ncbi:hypothetical protein L1987_09358 [Smallanthus sonchifolius]|uniref:Uncharacterized protein n=1 Tax=Smallanthus sonchifolius TaxID=185202 RepID=A0ACB9JPG0_9ASTR|nr:hypothetical protein L1987_09358 [Smallanthus sonchifolius]
MLTVSFGNLDFPTKVHSPTKATNGKKSDDSDDLDSTIGLGFNNKGFNNQIDDYSTSDTSKPVLDVSHKFFDKFKNDDIPTFFTVRFVKEGTNQEPSKDQTPTTLNDTTISVNQYPLEEDYISSDDESETNKCLGELKFDETSEFEKPQVCKPSENQQKTSPSPVKPHGTIKHQNPFKACFKCGKEGHLLKKPPK